MNIFENSTKKNSIKKIISKQLKCQLTIIHKIIKIETI
jgi:hypothetical protein